MKRCTITSILDEYASKPMTSIDILQRLDGKTNIVLYRDLYKYSNIEQLLYPHGSFILLYESSPNSGHWVAILKSYSCNNIPLIEFFDPYGCFPDSQQQYINKSFLSVSGQKYKKLTELLLNSNPNYLISFNHHKFQMLDNNIATCGRWCMLRILLKDICLQDFINLVEKKSLGYGLSKDRFVTLVTFNI
jgi:hypothetical protein